jgi:hypothetical protein
LRLGGPFLVDRTMDHLRRLAVVPAYNESATVASVVAALHR